MKTRTPPLVKSAGNTAKPQKHADCAIQVNREFQAILSLHQVSTRLNPTVQL